MKNKEIKFKLAPGMFGGNLESRNLSLCFSGVLEAFPGIPEDTLSVTFVFSERAQPEAAKITYSISQSDVEWLKMNGGIADDDYVLWLDNEDTYLMHYADQKMRKLWDEGYNYIRAEYSA